MNRLAIVLLLSALLLSARSAEAGPAASGLRDALRAMGTSDSVPAEWSGVWTFSDSTYNCSGGLTGTASGTDTLCTGQSTYQPAPGSPVTFTCTGTADATTFHVTCTGSMDVFPDCTAMYDVHVDGTRIGDSYFTVTTLNLSYSGTGTGCDLFPGTCQQINTHGTRIGAAPADYCATPTQPSTWGRIKTLYR